jgi:Flp pilus assembly pilin Flp
VGEQSVNKLIARFWRRRRGQAQTEYIIVVALTLFASVIIVNGIDLGKPDTGSEVDTTGLNVPHTQVVTIPGLKDALYVYQNKLFVWISEAKPDEFIW